MPVDGPELEHAVLQGDDFLEDGEVADGCAAVAAAFAGEFGEDFEEEVLGIGAGDVFFGQLGEGERLEEGRQAVPLGVMEAALRVVALEPVEIEVFRVAGIGGVVVALGISGLATLGGDGAGGVAGGLLQRGGEETGRRGR